MSRHLFIPCLVCLAVLAGGGRHTALLLAHERAPLYGGTFYPADAENLLRTIEQMTRQARMTAPPRFPPGRLRALIMPHAGYPYSGVTAAHVSCVLEHQSFKTVIVLGPDHRLGLSCAGLSGAERWRTPLGLVDIDPDNDRLQQHSDRFRVLSRSEDREHSLEVVLPFLQVYLESFKLLPIVLGPCDHEQIGDTLDSLIRPQTLVVVSADLSHFQPYPLALARDKATIQAILDLDSRPIIHDDNRTCGKHPISVLLYLARKHRWRPVLLAYANSGDTAGDRRRVVGYAAIAFFGEIPMPSNTTPPLNQSQGRALLMLARNTLMERFNREIPESQRNEMQRCLEDPQLQTPCGTFVTLKIGRQLRGCIGSLTGMESIVDGVRTHAISAAFHDPRFHPLRARELDHVVIEVSVLTEPEPLDYSDAEDLASKLRPDIDGVTIRKGAAGATFLPQVWQQLPQTEAFLSQLCMKAGLAPETWRRDRLEVETYQVQYFEEHH